MGGLQNIIDHINEESRQQIKGILSEAEARIEAMKEESRKRTDDECSRIAEKAESERQLILERGQASADLRKKQLLLSARQELITETIQDCLRKLRELPDDQYFEMLERLFVKHLPSEDAELRFNARDLGRMPESFRSFIASKSEKAGVRTVISDRTEDMDGGFVMDFGETEEDLSFSSMAEQYETDIRDLVSRVLFS